MDEHILMDSDTLLMFIIFITVLPLDLACRMSNKIFGLGRIHLREAITQNKGNICVLTLRCNSDTQCGHKSNILKMFVKNSDLLNQSLVTRWNEARTASGSRFPPFPKNPPLSNHYENLSHMCLPIKAKCYE